MGSTKISAQLKSRRINISPSIVRRRIYRIGFKENIALKNPILQPKSIDGRLKFANDHLQLTPADWELLLLSDEFVFRTVQTKRKKLSAKTSWRELASILGT